MRRGCLNLWAEKDMRQLRVQIEENLATVDILENGKRVDGVDLAGFRARNLGDFLRDLTPPTDIKDVVFGCEDLLRTIQQEDCTEEAYSAIETVIEDLQRALLAD